MEHSKMSEKQYEKAKERIEEIKDHLETLRIEKTKLIQAVYYYENRDRIKAKYIASKKVNNSAKKY